MDSIKDNENENENKIKLIIKLYDTSLNNYGKRKILEVDDDYIVLNNNNEIIKTKYQSDSENNENNCFLFYAEIKQIKDDFNIYIDNLISENNIYQNLALIDEIDKNLWYVIQSRKKGKEGKKRINKNYFLLEGDIIKLGNKKFLINEINIDYYIKEKKSLHKKKEDNNDEKKMKIYEDINLEAEQFLSGEIKNYRKCKLCETYNIQICDCEKISHFFCFASNINNPEKKLVQNIIDINNNDNKVIKYYLPNFFCSECNCQYSFRYKIPEKNTFLNSVQFDTIVRDNYMIMESIGSKDKTVFIIFLSKGNIIVGNDKNKENDIIIEDPSIKEQHAKIFFDTKKGKVKIESLNENDFDTSVLVRKEILLSENKILLKVENNVFIVNALKDEEILSESSDSSDSSDDDDEEEDE